MIPAPTAALAATVWPTSNPVSILLTLRKVLFIHCHIHALRINDGAILRRVATCVDERGGGSDNEESTTRLSFIAWSF